MSEVDDDLKTRIRLNRKIQSIENAIETLEDVQDDISIKFNYYSDLVIELLEIYVADLKKELGEN